MSSLFNRKLALRLFIAIVISGCGDTEVVLPEYEPKVVVEGFIEQGKYPEVYLTMSSGFYDPVDSVKLRDHVLATAKVTVSDGVDKEVLTLFANKGAFPPFYYRGTDLRGEVGKTYTLEVVSKGETYFASTTIPAPVELDNVSYKYIAGSDSLANVLISFRDEPGALNYYRTFTRVRGVDDDFRPVYQSVVGDRFFDDDSIELLLLRGTGSFTGAGSEVYYRRGDTVAVRFCTLDEAHFDFWRTLEKELYLTGNPFGSAGNEILSNIEGTKPALGVWGGYGASYYEVVIR